MKFMENQKEIEETEGKIKKWLCFENRHIVGCLHYYHPLHQEPMENQKECVFCDQSKIKGIVYQDSEYIVFEPLNPVVAGHLVFILKEHTKDFSEKPKLTAKLMEKVARFSGRIVGDYNIITSKGKNATQPVFHLHVHLVPRKENDRLALPWTKQKSLWKKEAVEAIKKLRELEFAGKDKHYQIAVEDAIKIIESL